MALDARPTQENVICVAPDETRHHLLRVQGPQARENLASLRELTPQRHERRPIRYPKGCKNGARKQNKDTFTAPVFKLDFEVPFLRDSDAKSTRNVPIIVVKTIHF